MRLPELLPPWSKLLEGIESSDTLSKPFFRKIVLCVCVCVCVFFTFILDINFVGRTSRGHTVEEGHTGFLIHLLSAVRALIFLARRIQPFLSLVDREVEFCVLTI